MLQAIGFYAVGVEYHLAEKVDMQPLTGLMLLGLFVSTDMDVLRTFFLKDGMQTITRVFRLADLIFLPI